MKTDKFWMSALWGRLGAAIILIVGTVLQQMGITITQDQMASAHSIIGELITNLHIVVAAALVIISKIREHVKEVGSYPKAITDKRGSVHRVLLVVMLLIGLITMGIVTTGCSYFGTQSTGNPIADVANSLIRTKAAVKSAAIAVDAMCKQQPRIIPEQTCQNASEAYSRAQIAYAAANDAIVAAVAANSMADPTAAQAQINAMTGFLGNLNTILQTYLPQGGAQ